MGIYDFGTRMSQLRERKNLTQKQAAHLIGVSRTMILEYEAGSKMPKVETLKRIAEIYGTSADYILGIDNRKCIYLDGLSDVQQDIIIDFIDKLVPEMK